ncbi:MAG: hypothetical protein JWQ87_1851 [Candidatus Sulfotelmatobacter sp.]|nr:hypothetical protein [Candidatus Sulfotelmatobacter sp.]
MQTPKIKNSAKHDEIIKALNVISLDFACGRLTAKDVSARLKAVDRLLGKRGIRE